MEDMVGMINPAFWRKKKVFLTGHTGFKGSWMSLWLASMGTRVTGYSLQPPTDPSMYKLCQLDGVVHSVIGDIRDIKKLSKALVKADPDIVIHMAAQSLVRESYRLPADTYEINVMGTVNVLEAIRHAVSIGIPIKAFINVTTDKCYENQEWIWSYRENDRLGGFDPYSNSKSCSELVTSAYRNSYFSELGYEIHQVAIASARAGNVIGGGDWAPDRLIPDCFRAFFKHQEHQEIVVRNPSSVRPWQHVLEPLNGYLLLAQKLMEDGERYSEAWNFGPDDHDYKTVEWIVSRLCDKWGNNSTYRILDDADKMHEARLLKLDSTKAKLELGWRPIWTLDETLDRIVEWNKAFVAKENMQKMTLKQIEAFMYGAGKH